MNNELYHYGVKGMKWGVRKKPESSGGGSNNIRNPIYSDQQRRRDRRVYGNSSVKRINKNMNRGESISAARSIESDRLHTTRRRAVVSGQVGSVLGSVAGVVGSRAVMSYLEQNNPSVASLMSDPGTRMAVNMAVTTGSIAIGKQLGRYGMQSATMAISGYQPEKFRYGGKAKKSLRDRYADFGVKSAEKSYGKKIDDFQRRREKRIGEFDSIRSKKNPNSIRNKYADYGTRRSNQYYDNAISDLERRKKKRINEFNSIRPKKK